VNRTLLAALAAFAVILAVRDQPTSAASSRGKKKAPATAGLPQVFLFDPQTLLDTRGRVRAGDHDLAAAAGRLKRDADRAVQAGTYSVVSVDKSRPSGDKHDYISLARYAWPDPKKPDGLPWVLRDGETNPLLKDYCSPVMANMAHHAFTCALAYYLLGDETYAAHAAKLMRTWFLDPATRMNPHLKYAQFMPGKNEGGKSGLIDSRDLVDVVNAAGLLAGSPAWTKTDQYGLETWFRQYLQWLLTSPLGQKEAVSTNNHAVWYDVQTTAFALFTGQDEVARKILREAGSRRIAPQIEPDGSMPLELRRTRSFDYSIFNVEAFFDLAAEGQYAGVDLWNFRTPDGRAIRKALDFMLPYTVGGQTWQHQQIKKYDVDTMFPLLRRAAIAYHEPKYEELIGKLPPKDFAAERTNLLFPKAAITTAHGRN